jgi:N-acetylglutamate synthase-like GNAT family acetyltransferase
MSDFQIRRARLDDLPAIQELIRSSFQALVDFYPALAASFAGPALDHMLSDLNADQFDSVYSVNASAFWVAVDSSLKLIGSVALKCNKHPHEGELVRMAVAPGLRGGGIGRKLVTELETHCHAHGILRVQAVTANPLSAKFYQEKVSAFSNRV